MLERRGKSKVKVRPKKKVGQKKKDERKCNERWDEDMDS
jgi:hypothetical protein